MTQVTNTRTFYLPGDHINDELETDLDLNNGYIPFDHSLRFLENVRVPVTGQTTMTLTGVQTTPANGAVYQEYSVADDVFYVDYHIPLYTPTARPPEEGLTYTPADLVWYPFTENATSVDSTAVSFYEYKDDEEGTLTGRTEFPKDGEGKLYSLYEEPELTTENNYTQFYNYKFKMEARQRFFGQFYSNMHHQNWIAQMAANTKKPGVDKNAPYIKVRVALKGAVYDPLHKEPNFTGTVNEAPFASLEGPFKSQRFEEPCRAANVPSSWPEPWNETADVLDGVQLNQTDNGGGQFTERLTDAIIHALANRVNPGQVLWNPTEEESKTIHATGSLISVWSGMDNGGIGFDPDSLWGECTREEFDFFYIRVLFEMLKSTRVHGVIDATAYGDVPRVQVSIRHTAFFADLMTEPHTYKQTHNAIGVNDRDADEFDADNYTSGGFLSDSISYYQEHPLDLYDMTLNNPSATKMRVIPLHIPVRHGFGFAGSTYTTQYYTEHNMINPPGIGTVFTSPTYREFRPRVADNANQIINVAREAPNSLFGFRVADHGHHLSARIDKGHVVVSPDAFYGPTAFHDVERTMYMFNTINTFFSVSLESPTQWGSRMLGVSSTRDKLTGQCAPSVRDTIQTRGSFWGEEEGVVLKPDNDLRAALQYNWGQCSVTRQLGEYPFTVEHVNGVDEINVRPLGAGENPCLFLTENSLSFNNPYFTHAIDPVPSTMLKEGYQPVWPTKLDVSLYEDITTMEGLLARTMEHKAYALYASSGSADKSKSITAGDIRNEYNGCILVAGFQPLHLMHNTREKMVQQYYSTMFGPDIESNSIMDRLAQLGDINGYNKFIKTYLTDTKSVKRKDNGAIIKQARGFIRPAPWRINELRDSHIYVFVDIPSASSNNVTTAVDAKYANSVTQDSMALVAVLDANWQLVYQVNISLMFGTSMYNIRVVLKNGRGTILRVRGKVSFFLDMVTRTDISNALV